MKNVNLDQNINKYYKGLFLITITITILASTPAHLFLFFLHISLFFLHDLTQLLYSDRCFIFISHCICHQLSFHSLCFHSISLSLPLHSFFKPSVKERTRLSGSGRKQKRRKVLCVSVCVCDSVIYILGSVFSYILDDNYNKYSCEQQLLGFKRFKAFKHMCKKVLPQFHRQGLN